MNKSEQLLSAFSEDYFFKELVLEDLRFTPVGASEIELADLLINLGDIIIAIQLKTRNDENQTDNPLAESKWLQKKCKVAKGQAKESLQIISSGILPVLHNKRGQSVLLQQDAEIIPLVVFENSRIGDYPHLLGKHSDSGMNINCMSFPDYCEMCRILVTPMEIVEYLEYRKIFYEEHGDVDILILNGMDNEMVLTKPRENESLVHQFLAEKYGMKESARHRSYIQYFRNFLHLLPERTVRSSDQADTYTILLFLAHLQRYEITEFWDVLEDTKAEAKQGVTGIRHSLRHEISGYVIMFAANGLIPMEALLPVIRRKVNPVRVLEIEVHWFDKDTFGIDFLYWDNAL
ncbi:MAG: hypothetical protein ACI4NQ_06090 [Christensenellales bacterium]